MGSEAVTLHARLVDRLGNPKGIRDGYALRWLPWAPRQGGRDTERRALIVDVEWIMAKLMGGDIQSLIADYEYFPKEEDLRIVQSALRLSAHILARNPRDLPAQLIARLPENLTCEIDALRTQASEEKSFAWLRPLKASLTPLDASLVRTLQGRPEPERKRLNGLRPTLRVGALHLNPRPRSVLLLLRPLSVGRFASLRFRPKNTADHIFQLESELQNIPEAAPKAPPAGNAQSGLAFNGVPIILYNYTSGIAPGFAYRLLAEGVHRSLLRGQIPRCSRRPPLRR